MPISFEAGMRQSTRFAIRGHVTDRSRTRRGGQRLPHHPLDGGRRQSHFSDQASAGRLTRDCTRRQRQVEQLFAPFKDLRKAGDKWRTSGETVALVPTMGALHDGHLSLVKLAKKKADRVVVSIFVNPTQFAPHEDLARYPRDEAGDVKKLAEAAPIWSGRPTVAEMYPEGFSTSVNAGQRSSAARRRIPPAPLRRRRDGVLQAVQPSHARCRDLRREGLQQLAVLRQMVRDLDLPLKIIGAPTSREKDGLALSSRNAYLTEAERDIAPALYAAISRASRAMSHDGADIAGLYRRRQARSWPPASGKIDYVEVRDAETLAEPSRGRTPAARPRRRLARQNPPDRQRGV